MGLVTNVFWTCPNCDTANQAQVYGECDDPEEFPITAVPESRGLKWDPPCGGCGQFQLKYPEERLVELEIRRVSDV